MLRCYHSASAAGASLGAERKCSSLGSTVFRITATTNATAMQFEAKICWNSAGNCVKMSLTWVKPMPMVSESAAIVMLRCVKPA